MNDTVIRTTGLSKKFIIGHQVEQDSLLREAMTRGARALFRRTADLIKGRTRGVVGRS